ncbi:MAG: hypothetical protein AMJ75_08660 [Phycisphaerae bacterium SM1_79]|nr:MAG: hypothetical protein AMJ75_08660 [Phycisphaerae bacterium SM1_79]
MIGEGDGTHQTAEKLQPSIKTIETHRVPVKENLSPAGAAEPLEYAVPWVNSRRTGSFRHDL